LANQELNARIREEAILTNLKQENTALWTKLKEVEEQSKKVMNINIKEEFPIKLVSHWKK
jgi:hypothetical protein